MRAKEKKYGKLNEKFTEKIKHPILSKMKKQQNRGIQEILWKTTENKTETAEETQIQCNVEKEFQWITNGQGDKKERNTEIIIRKVIRRMKNKKASDRLGWKAKWIKGRGEEMVKSLYTLFNRIKTESQIKE